jgi:DNA primase
MSVEWIDFKELRQRLKLGDVLRHYRIDLKANGQRATGLCPLPTHPKRGEGKRTASFSVSFDRGLWNCFGCRAGGNAFDLAIRMEGKDPGSSDDVRSVALKIVREFGIDSRESNAAEAPKRPRTGRTARGANGSAGRHSDAPQAEKSTESPTSNASLPVVVNAALDFELRQLDPTHRYLFDRGFTADTIAYFGLGFCSRGLLKDRIAIPLHDPAGQLVGYAGRIVDDKLIDDDHPKYLLPGPRERDGKRYELHKSELLYNAHRVEESETLIVVEGFASVWWLDQHGFRDVVALMGCSCSERQADLICERLTHEGTLIVLTDGDDAGRECAGDIFRIVGDRRRCRYASLDDGEQPTDLGSEALAGFLSPLIDGT